MTTKEDDLSLCPKHGQERTLYCSNKDCLDFICQECIESHNGHNVQLGRRMRTALIDDLTQQIAELNEWHSKIQTIFKESQLGLAGVQEKGNKAEETKRELFQSFKLAVKEANVHEVSVREKLVTGLNDLTQEAKKLQDDIIQIRTKCDRYQKELSESEQPSTLQLTGALRFLKAPMSVAQKLRELDVHNGVLKLLLEEERARSSAWLCLREGVMLSSVRVLVSKMDTFQHNIETLTQKLEVTERHRADQVVALEGKLQAKSEEVEGLKKLLETKANKQDVEKVEAAIAEKDGKITALQTALDARATIAQVTELTTAKQTQEGEINTIKNAIKEQATKQETAKLMEATEEIKNRIGNLTTVVNTKANADEMATLRAGIDARKAEIEALKAALPPHIEGQVPPQPPEKKEG